MKTLKQLIGVILMLALLTSVVFAFASCDGTGTGEGAGDNGGSNEGNEENNENGENGENGSPVVVPNTVTYTVTVKNSSGKAVPGVQLKIVDAEGEEMYYPGTTGVNGTVSGNLYEGEWKVQLISVPKAYSIADYSVKYDFNADRTVEIVLTNAQ